LVDARVTVCLLTGFALFHVAVFLLSGLNFLAWAGTNLLFALAVSQASHLFDAKTTLVSIILILTALYWQRPVRLAWLDSRLTCTYRIDAVGRSGTVYRLLPHFFGPYDFVFHRGLRWSDEPLVTETWGECYRPDVVLALQAVDSKEAIAELERTYAASNGVRKNPVLVGRTRAFLSTYVEEFGRRRGRFAILGAFPFARESWLGCSERVYQSEEPLEEVRIRLVKVLLRDVDLEVVSDKIACTFPLRSPPAVSHAGPDHQQVAGGKT
jgi:hypothetical protein